MDMTKYPLVDEHTLCVTGLEVLGKLPDPFLFEDGHRVTTRAEWELRRRELYKTVIELQYGTMPPPPEVFRVEAMYVGRPRTYRITAGTRERQVSFRMQLWLPAEPTKTPPPVIVDGNQCFGYPADREWLGAALDEGVGWALFDRTELAHDIQGEGRRRGALYEVYPAYSFGALGAWAWGYSRVVDALEQIGLTDMDCIAFTGHSRGGKTAALAGALDERAAIVNPNETCAGACGCYRVHMTGHGDGIPEFRSERLADLWQNFGYWMGEGMEKYAKDEASLPFDCHELKAMIAPRTLFISEAAGDLWANPIGSYLTTQAAREVYRFLGAEDALFWYFRPGIHYHRVEDVCMLVSLVKRRRDGGEGFDPSRFFRLPFPEPRPIFGWSAPTPADNT